VSEAATLASGKGHRDENFPVASFILKPAHREAVMAFYRFARKADDVADHDREPPQRKRDHLEGMRRTLVGTDDADEEALRLRQAQAAKGVSPAHALDLLQAFDRDTQINRYASWEALIDYCRLSAMPVGRFVLDVHGEDRALWTASDALCAALQIINHLQDCQKDYLQLDRVYLPQEDLDATGARIEDLRGEAASPALLQTIRRLAVRTSDLLQASRPFAAGLRDQRLALEVAVIQRLAEGLNEKLKREDPLRTRVRHTPAQTLTLVARAGLDRLLSGPWADRGGRSRGSVGAAP
jgi:squalene synthase HpnC